MPKQITDKTADMIVTATDRLCDYIDSGDTEVEAGVKVAHEFNLTSDQIKLVGRSYNIGVVNADRRDSDSFSAKFAVTSRLDPEDVIARVFPKEAKAATPLPKIASVYLEDPVKLAIERSKTASMNPPAPKPYEIQRCSCGCGKKEGECADKDLSNYGKAKKKVAALTAKRAHLRRLESDAVSKAASVIDAYRSEFGNDTTNLLWFRKVAGDYYGETGQILVDRIATKLMGPVVREKFAAAAADPGSIPGQQPMPIDFNKGVFAAIKEAYESLADWLKAEQEFPAHVIQERREIDRLIGRTKASTCILPLGMTREQYDEQVWQKRSSMLAGMVGGLASTMSSSKAGPTSGLDSTALLSARVKLNDPSHQAELKRIQAETMLNSLINDDEVISSYSPDEIADAFEEISQSAPGLLDNRSLFRANMRRTLQGNLTPMDANDMFVQSQRASMPSALSGISDRDPATSQRM